MYGNILKQKWCICLARLYKWNILAAFICLNKGLVCAFYCASVMISIVFFFCLLNISCLCGFYILNFIDISSYCRSRCDKDCFHHMSPKDSWELRTCFGSLIRRFSIDGSSVRSCISLFFTLSIQVILMIERRCRIMKACSFFTCRLYTVQASAP